MHIQQTWFCVKVNFLNQIDVLKNRTAEKLEWGITYLLLKDREGFVSKELIRGMFDGSIFETMAKKVEAQKMQKKKM